MKRTATGVYAGTLYRISYNTDKHGDTHPMRTESMEGYCYDLPAVGAGFCIFGESMTAGMDARMITTSRVEKVEEQGDGGVEFHTRSGSHYLFVTDME